jgi:UDP-N-acetylmuramoyl-L-alanyl-D-glutamate--2,6-diaminopimelate ligase
MKDFLRQILPNQHPLRLAYHKLMAMVAAIWYGFPARRLKVIAVTGTNGKTTTSNYIHHIFTQAGLKAGLLTTVHFKLGEETEVNMYKQTTVSPFALQKKLRQMVDSRCSLVVLEVTSHAMIQSRLWGVNVDAVVFTNLTPDHVEYHGSMDAYREAKGLLFKHLNASPRKAGLEKVTVVNQDDPSHDYYDAFPSDLSFPYGIQKGSYVARNLQLRADGTTFELKVPNGEKVVNFPIPGRMNVYNAVAAACVALAYKLPLEQTAVALENMPPVPGRIEIIEAGQDFTVVVDYAHSEDALEQLLSMFKELTTGALIVVFGATGGGRDKGKRPIMGGILHKYADQIVITNDDPYEEDPKEIAQMLREGIPREEGDRLWQVLNRKEAIRLALSLAKAGDTVIVAGKGAEAFQVLGKAHILHDDRVVVRELLARPLDIEVPLPS